MSRSIAATVAAAAAGAVFVAVPVHGQELPSTPPTDVIDALAFLGAAALRLPLAAGLGAMLALRPRRPGTPPRSMPVVETQIILAVIGALIMLVVGASLARAFGILGAASLIRYRAKIDDPKDAVVMLATLSLGLAAGVGLYGLAIFAALFIGAALWAIESFEPAERKTFELEVKIKGKASNLKPKIERVLHRYRATAELRATAEDSVTYLVAAPASLDLERVSNALTGLVSDDSLAVEWQEKGKKKG